MENYATYQFYANQYGGSLSNDLFNSLIVRASREIDKNVNRQLTTDIINSLTATEKYQLQYTACRLVDFCNMNDEIKAGHSVSIDGVSINNIASANMKESKLQILDNLPIKLTRYL